MKTRITKENLDQIKKKAPEDLAGELEAGCESWPFQQGNKKGQMVVWPSGRAAIEKNGKAEWGHWSPRRELLTSYDGNVYDAEGREVPQPETVMNFVLRGVPRDNWKKFLDLCQKEGLGPSQKLRAMIAGEVQKTMG